MERVTSKGGAEHEPDEARAWLEQNRVFPPLEDRSREGRRAFVDAHGPVLWAYWRDLFSLAYADGTLRPALALGAATSGSDQDAGAEVAERLLAALCSRPQLDEAPAWSQIERWHAWLVGKKATAAHRNGQPSLPRSTGNGASDGQPGGGADALADLERLLDRWVAVLRVVVTGTGIAAIELDWLWATRRARKPLGEAFASHPDYGHLADADLDTCIRRSSAPGDERAERIRRSRAGACAAFRFDLEELASRAGREAVALTSARRVFIGPAEPEGPYHHPKLPITPDARVGFRDALRRIVELSTPAPDDGPVDRLWRDVLACGLNKSVLRLLPAGAAARPEDGFDALLASRRTTRRHDEGAS